MMWTRLASILHLLAAPAFAAVLWAGSIPSAVFACTALLVSAAMLWLRNRWVVIYSGLLAVLSLGFLFFLALTVRGAALEHVIPTAIGSGIFLLLHAGAVLAEWVGADSTPEITVQPD